MRKLAAILLLPFALVAATAAQAAITPGATPGNFTVSESGAASYSIPIAVAPGTAGMEPKLSLNYSSQGGSGIAGTGWSLSGLSAVTRCGNSLIQDGINRGVQYDAKDRFCLDGQRLIVINGGTYGAVGAEYRTEIESFTKVLSYGGVAGDPQYFKAQTKSGQILEFGNTADSRAEAQGKTQAAAWTVNKISDTVGNYLGFTYTENNATGEQRVSRIDYTGNSATGLSPYNHIDFSYAARANTAPAVYVAGSMNQLTQRLTAITTWAGTIQARTYTLAYAAQGDFLASVQECDGAGTCVNPTTFTWQFPAASAGDFEAVTQVVNFAPKTGWFASSGDVNGDGFDDHLKSKVLIKPFSLTVDDLSYLLLRLATGDANVFAPAVEVATTALRDCSIVANCNGASQKTSLVSILGDINGDGRADLILGDGGVALSNGDGTLAAPYQANVQIGSAPFASARDVNGDGRADLMFGRAEVDNLTHYYIQYVQGNGTFGVPQPITTAPIKQHVRDSLYSACVGTLGDFNGDGRADLVTCEWKVYLSTDSGWLDAGQWRANTGSDGYFKVALSTGDVNGDGLADLFYMSDEISTYPTRVAKSDGHVFSSISTSGISGDPAKDRMPLSVAGSFSGRGQADVVGDGNDATTDPSTYTGLINRAAISPNYAITTITDGLGASRSITYKPISDPSVYTAASGAGFPYRDLQTAAPMNVVSDTFADDGAGGSFHLNYQYGAARTDYYRGFTGFQMVEASDVQSGIVTTSVYRQDYPFTGMPSQVLKTSRSGVVLNQVDNTYASTVIANGGLFPYLAYSKSQSSDLNGTALPFTETWNENFDAFGNVGKVTVKTSNNFTTWTTNTYTNDAAKWLLGRLTRAVVTKATPANWQQTRTSAFAYNATTGLLNQETIEPDTASLRLITEYLYDAYGNKIKATVSGGDPQTGTSIVARSTSTTYDAQGRFALTETNALGQKETRVFDPRFGLMTSLTGPNALTTTWAYDGFGRKTLETRSDGTQTTSAWAVCSGCSWNAVYFTTTQNTGSAATSIYYDKLKRAVHTTSLGFDGVKQIYTTTEYDNQGRVKRSYRPRFNGPLGSNPIYWTTPTYDDLGRTIRVDSPDGTFSTMAYNGLTTVATNPKGQTRTEVKNSQGQTISVTDSGGGVLRHAYDPFGNHFFSTNPLNQIFAPLTTYDIRGRKVGSSDPDMGAWSYAYNALGELVKQTDAKNQVTTMSYDVLGRMVSRVEPGMTSTWTYDTAAKGIGKLAKETNGSVTKTYVYDTLGRPSTTTTAVDSQSLVQTVTYDSAGRVLAQTYPTGFGTKNIYNATGYLSEVDRTDTNVYVWKALIVDAEGRVTQDQVGNGVTNKHIYEATTGRLTGIQANAPNAALIHNQTYTWDSIGNLQTRADTLSGTGRSETFQYDSLNRLTQANLSLGGITQTPVTATYDALGNLTSKSDYGAYTYDPTQIHAVSKVSLGTVDRLYTYDANGNQLTGPGRTLTWTGWNMPATLVESTGTTSWSYDPGHQRIKQTQPGKTTYFLNPRIDTGGHYERVVYTSGQVDNIHILYAGGQIIGQYVTSTASVAKTRYFHLDHLGSVSVVTNETGTVVDRYAYDAWGKRVVITGSTSETEHGFTGHEHLDDGLIHMNGRIYDPVLARFLSADPYVQDAGDSQAYNRFAYVRNNPLCYADPSGFSWWTKFRDNWIRPIVAAIASYYTFGLVSGLISYVPGAFAAGALAGGAVSSLINTGNLSNLGQSSLSTLLFAGANGIGIDGSFSRALANAGAGCISAASSGGSCGQGGGTFLAAYALGRSLDFVTQDLRLYGVSGADVPSAELSRIGGSGNAFINGIKNTVNDAINNFRDISHLGGDFILIYNPSAGFFGDLVESAQDVLGSGSKVSRQLAGILGDAQASGYSVNLWAHSQGGAILGSALGQLSGMKGLTVNMAGAAANQGVVVSAAARAGASMGAFKTNSFDFVTMVIGRNGNPLQMLGATLASPLLFGGRDMSPHSGPAYSQ
ncbi:MAG: RHS repeat-associated core domain-containing protein [Thiobacillaceae bacterium]